MRALTALVVVAIASTGADAKAVDSIRPEPKSEVQTIQIGRPDKGAAVSRIDVGLWVQQTRTMATLDIYLVGADAELRDVQLPLVLPPGSRAVAMEVQIAEITTPATLMAAGAAHEFYDKTVAAWRDPALLERRGSAYNLHVFPIVANGIQRVVITIQLPRADRLTIAPPSGRALDRMDVDLLVDGRTAKHDSFLRVAKARQIELPAPAPGIAEDPSFDRDPVDAAHSLVAGRTAEPTGMPTVSIGAPGGGWRGWRGERTLDKAIIKRHIKPQMAKLTYCYERELFRDKTLTGTVELRFAIELTGKVTVLDVGGTLTDPAVQSCIKGVFESIEFPEHDDARIVINYPLSYHLAGQ